MTTLSFILLQFKLSSEYTSPKLLYFTYKNTKTGFLCDSRFSLELFLLMIHDLSVRCMENSREDKIVLMRRVFWVNTFILFKDDYVLMRSQCSFSRKMFCPTFERFSGKAKTFFINFKTKCFYSCAYGLCALVAKK